VLAIIVPIPARLDELAGGDHGGVADNGDQIPLPARLHTQHGKAVFLVVERDALNEPSEDLGAALSRLRFHHEPLSTDDPTPSAGTRRCILFPVVMPETDGVRRVRPTDDDEFFTVETLRLNAESAVARRIWAVDPLGHGAFEAEPTVA
jgi:hypothetical protein